MSLATNDTLAVRQAVGPAVMYTANTVISFVIGLAVMIHISPWLTLAALVPLAVLPPVVTWFGKVIHVRFERIQEQFAALSDDGAGEPERGPDRARLRPGGRSGRRVRSAEPGLSEAQHAPRVRVRRLSPPLWDC